MKIAVSLIFVTIFGGFNSAIASVHYDSLHQLENILQSGVGNQSLVVDSHPDEHAFLVKVVKLLPVLKTINHNQSEVIRVRLAQHIADQKKLYHNEKYPIDANLGLTGQLPPISATSYVVYDPLTDRILASKNPYEVRSIASISKLFTAMVALDEFRPDQNFIMTSPAKTVGSASDIKVGELFNLSEAISYLLNQSANDVANQLVLTHDALYFDSKFTDKMTSKAVSMGLYNTSFNNPSGLLPQNKSSAIELAKLIKYMQADYPELLSLGRQVVINRRGNNLVTTNPIRSIPNWLGGKNGYISASGRTLTSLFQVGNKQVIISLLNTPTDQSLQSDTALLLNLVR